MVASTALLNAFCLAYPDLARMKSLEAHLLEAGWGVRTEKLPAALSSLVALIPKTRRLDTKQAVLKVLGKTYEGREIWVLLQQSSIRNVSLNMVGFYDFDASAPIDSQAVSQIIGSEPLTAQDRDGEIVAAEWQKSGEAPGLRVTVSFTPRPDQVVGPEMIGARIIATVRAAP